MKHPGFANRFRQAIAKAGIDDTQRYLSKLFGVSEVMIWSYKNGEKLPRMAMAVKIANTLDISVEWLLQGKEYQLEEQAAEFRVSQLDRSTQDIIEFAETLSESQRIEALSLLLKSFQPDK